MTKLETIYLLLVSHITEKIEAQRNGINVLYHTNIGKSTLYFSLLRPLDKTPPLPYKGLDLESSDSPRESGTQYQDWAKGMSCCLIPAREGKQIIMEASSLFPLHCHVTSGRTLLLMCIACCSLVDRVAFCT